MWFHVQQQFDDFPHRPRHLKLGLGLLFGNPAGHEFDLKDEFHILSSIRKTPFICIFFSSFKPSQLFFFFLLSHFPRMPSEPDVQNNLVLCALLIGMSSGPLRPLFNMIAMFYWSVLSDVLNDESKDSGLEKCLKKGEKDAQRATQGHCH